LFDQGNGGGFGGVARGLNLVQWLRDVEDDLRLSTVIKLAIPKTY